MAIIGWLFLVVVLLYFTGVVLGVLFNCGGEFNIGGVPNMWWEKLIAWVLVMLDIFLWYELLINSPFTVSFK